jgi:hypothetical protein
VLDFDEEWSQEVSQQAHPTQTIGDLVGIQTPLRGDDAEEVLPSSLVATVEEVLQRGEVSRCLVHVNSESGPPHLHRDSGVAPGSVVG